MRARAGAVGRLVTVWTLAQVVAIAGMFAVAGGTPVDAESQRSDVVERAPGYEKHQTMLGAGEMFAWEFEASDGMLVFEAITTAGAASQDVVVTVYQRSGDGPQQQEGRTWIRSMVTTVTTLVGVPVQGGRYTVIAQVGAIPANMPPAIAPAVRLVVVTVRYPAAVAVGRTDVGFEP
jgi:hypothetical protein